MNALNREIDAEKKEKEIIKEKIGEYWEQIDLEVSNLLNRGIGVRTIKCVCSFNDYNKHNCHINKGLVSSMHPEWEHVIQCESANLLNLAHSIDFKEQMPKVKHSD